MALRTPFYNWEGPVDRGVPIRRVNDNDGKLLAVVFGYTCHNTAIPPDGMKFHGRSTGTAQLELEKGLSRATALFVMACGGDTNPYLYGCAGLAEIHGKALAGMVEVALRRDLRPIRWRSAFTVRRVSDSIRESSDT